MFGRWLQLVVALQRGGLDNGLCFICGPARPASTFQVTRTSGRNTIDARDREQLLPLTTTFQQGKPASASNCWAERSATEHGAQLDGPIAA